ncbi:hypothetical protein ACEPAG_9476 [Sanghuangporus baumii]
MVDQEEREKRVEEQDIAADLLFPDSDITADRLQCLNVQNNLLGKASWMPENLRGVKVALNMVRHIHVQSCVQVEEKSPMLQMNALQGKHDMVKNSFSICVNLATRIESADTPQLSGSKDELDEKQAPAHTPSQVHKDSLSTLDQRPKTLFEGDEEEQPEFPTACRIEKRKKVEKSEP